MDPDRRAAGAYRGYWVVSFTCTDCSQDFARFTRVDPELIRRCQTCEYTSMRQDSERILTLVFGTAAQA